MASALKSWELTNSIHLIDPSRDALFAFDPARESSLRKSRPWRDSPSFFKHVRVSAVALLKMVMHARSGGSIEVMGLMQGHVEGDTFIVTDAFRLPVEGTETRVNAHEEANEYMARYPEMARHMGRLENVVGWYHSHPGYGCWLSGIDVGTQAQHQMFNDPFLAVVIDPERTVSAGKVDIGAFRTYPDGYKPPRSADADGSQLVPSDKSADFGAYADRYYALDVSHFKSSLDVKLLEELWNKYWVGTLSSNPLLSNRDYGTKQIKDLATKLHDAAKALASPVPGAGSIQGRYDAGAEDDKRMERLLKASRKIEMEMCSGLTAMEVKSGVFTAPGITVEAEKVERESGTQGNTESSVLESGDGVWRGSEAGVEGGDEHMTSS